MKYIRNQKYQTQEFLGRIMGPNPMKLAEELLSEHKISPGATVLDLGSGQGVTSVFLAKEYGFKVYAGDLWSDPMENRRFFDSCGLSEKEIIPVKADAENLPFDKEFFDAIVSLDSYNYFGRNTTYLDAKLLPFLKPGGLMYFSFPGMKKDLHDNLPPELLLSWTPDQLDYLHDTAYWKKIFEASTGAEIVELKEMESNEEVWNDWLACDNKYAVNDRQSMNAGGGKYLNFIAAVLRKRTVCPDISPCGDDCAKCPRFTAKDENELKKIAELWHRIGWRDTVISADEIRCRGCSFDKHCTYGLLECQAKKSSSQCRECKDYPCEKIADVLAKSNVWQQRCQAVCSSEEYTILEGAFFHKKENLRLSCSVPSKLISLKTVRLHISPMRDDEIQEMIATQKVPELTQAFSEMLDGSRTDPEHRIWFVPWKIVPAENPGLIIGTLGFKGPQKNGGVEIGYGMNSGFEGQGYMTEAAEAVVQWALTQTGVHTVFAETDAENGASQRVLQKLGFISCGTGEEGPRFQKMK